MAYEAINRFWRNNKNTIIAVGLTWVVTWNTCSYRPIEERYVPKEPEPTGLVEKKLKDKEYPVAGVLMDNGKKFIFLKQKDESFKRLDDIHDEERLGLEGDLGIK